MHVERAITRWQAAYKAKFIAYRKEIRGTNENRKAKRTKLDDRRSIKTVRVQGEGSDVDQDLLLYNQRYRDDYYGYDFPGSEAEDSDGIGWEEREPTGGIAVDFEHRKLTGDMVKDFWGGNHGPLADKTGVLKPWIDFYECCTS